MLACSRTRQHVLSLLFFLTTVYFATLVAQRSECVTRVVLHGRQCTPLISFICSWGLLPVRPGGFHLASGAMSSGTRFCTGLFFFLSSSTLAEQWNRRHDGLEDPRGVTYVPCYCEAPHHVNDGHVIIRHCQIIIHSKILQNECFLRDVCVKERCVVVAVMLAVILG